MKPDANPAPQKTSTNNGNPAPDVSLQPGADAHPTSPAEERGERVETGRQIARGGKDGGHVHGAAGGDPRGET
jgi:hypothetical protein